MSRHFAAARRRAATPRPVPSAAAPGGGDSIARFLREWRRERPDLDPTAFGIFGRIHRASGHFLRRAEEWLGALGLTWESFSLIVTLRRSGAPYALRPSDLLHESMLSSGAMTNRID